MIKRILTAALTAALLVTHLGPAAIAAYNSPITASALPAFTGDCTSTAGTVALTCLKTNNVNFGTSATVNTGTSGATIPLLNGANTYSGISTFTSGMVQTIRVVTAAGAVTVATTDNIVIVNKTSGAATAVNLPATPTTGTIFVVKDGKGDAATNNITVTPAAGNIDGSATFVMSVNYQSANLVYNGTQWNVW